jgi:hypothetical protein
MEVLMMSRNFLSFCAAVLAVCCAAAAHAQAPIVIGDFEDSPVPGSTGAFDGWMGATDSGGDGMGDTTATVGSGNNAVVTNETNARYGTIRSGGHNFWAATLDNAARPSLAADLAGSRFLQADVFFVASTFNDPEGNWGQWTKIAIQNSATGWTETPDPAPALNWNAGLGNLGATLTWDLSGIPVGDTASGSFAKIIMSINYARNEYASVGAQAPLFVIDNIRLIPIPEPSGLGLLGLGGLGLGALRRRRSS